MLLCSTIHSTLDNTSGRDVIKDLYSPVIVRIYRLSNEPFTENPDMMTCYGSDLGTFLAFESTYIVEHLPLITEALKWYTAHINHPDMLFQVNDPRPPHIDESCPLINGIRVTQ